MDEVKERMMSLNDHIKSEQRLKKQLYRWDHYDGYKALSRSIDAVEKTADRIQVARIHQEFARGYHRQARSFSISISHIAASTMSIMGDVSASCFDEIDQSELTSGAKDNARTVINDQLKKVIKYSTKATTQIWAAHDLIHDCFQEDHDDAKVNGNAFQRWISRFTKDGCMSRKGWLVYWVGTMLTIATSTVLAIAIMFGTAGFGLPLTCKSDADDMRAYLVEFSHRADIANIKARLECFHIWGDADKDWKDAVAISKATTQRLDALVESLGPPNEDGVYYNSKPYASSMLPDEVRQHVQKIMHDTSSLRPYLHQEVENLRKHINRVDIRLTKRIDKVEKNQKT